MAEALFPVTESPEFSLDTQTYDTEYHRTLKWDYEKMDYALDGQGDIEECDGTEGLKAWCAKMAYTERYQCLAYSDDIGVEMEDALSLSDEKVVESAISRTITEALGVNPRVDSVSEFEFDWDGDAVSVSFTVTGIDGSQFTIAI